MLKIKNISLIFIFLFRMNASVAQDTVSIMSYNLLKYSSTDGDKARYKDLRTIVKNAKPDALLVCELSDGGAPQLLLDSALNAAGIGTYSRAAFFDGTDTDNMLFYNTGKLKLKSQKQIYTVLRDISQYLVYSVLAPNDTAFIYLHMSHLKAGSFPSDENQRNSEVLAFCNSIASLPQTANILFAGDMNLKGSTEPAYNTLTSNNCSHTVYDPLNQPGAWNNNSTFSYLHTQSTRTSSKPGCCGGSTGGLDDRFDLILLNSPVFSGVNKVKYIPNSYKAYGNDNQHLNLAIIDAPANAIVPAAVTQALFNMSDHLPVTLKLELKPTVIGLKEYKFGSSTLSIGCVTHNNASLLGIRSSSEGNYTLKIMEVTGKVVHEESVYLKEGYQNFEIAQLNLSGNLYVVTLTNQIKEAHCLFSNIRY